MLSDRVSNPGPLTYESGALPIALRGPAREREILALNLFAERERERERECHFSTLYICNVLWAVFSFN